jgi:hypothetical protein
MPASSSANSNQQDVSSVEMQTQPLANSERIQQMFGSYAIEVLENDPGIRVSSLYSTHDGERVIRTFAVVAYPEIIEQAFSEEHAAIVSGQSIGTLFKNNGWVIEKHHQYFGETNTPSDLFFDTRNSAGNLETRAAIHVYTLVVKKHGSCFRYASIAEIHHPEFLQIEDLSAIYGADYANHPKERNELTGFLATVKARINALSTAEDG